MKQIRRTWPALFAVLTLAACGGGNSGSALTTPPAAPDGSAPPASATPATPPAPPAEQPANIALTTEGTVAGVAGADSIAFLGIPYAKPPVGERRWAPPQPPAAHQGTLQAAAFGSACLQGPGLETKSSEDCLYLNVWKPVGAKPGDKLPTIFYIHGGAFTIGSGAQGPAVLASRGVIVVSINYRLGALGFLANKALRSANKDGSLGNFALMDELAALDWTRRNIAAFGGDANNLTLWGLSAGATQSFSLLQSPKSAGLFQRAIMQSGGSGEYSNPSTDSSLAVGDTAVANLGCTTAADVVACLRAAPTAALLAQGGLKWRPTVDNKILTQVPARAFEAGNFNQVPVLIGGVYDEGTIFADTSETAANYGLYLHSLAPAGYDNTKLDAAYPSAHFAVPAQGYARALGDSLYSCANSARRTALSAWVPVYGYEFVDPQLSFPAVAPTSFYYGSSHGMDTYYFTAGVDALKTYPFFDQASATPDPTTTAQRKALSEQAIAYLLNFVRSSDPNGDGRNVSTRWPRFTGRADRTILSLTYPAAVATTDAFEQAHQCDTVWAPGIFPALY